MPLPRPPSADPLVALADQCVQCGLCLPACPTYRRDRIEAESPRGRIALARGWALEALAPTPAGDAHQDHCLACRSCEAVCPAGVKYGALLAEARRRQRTRRRPPARQRLVEGLAARPALLMRLLRLYRGIFPALPAAWRVLPRPPAGRPAAGDVATSPVAMPASSAARAPAPGGDPRPLPLQVVDSPAPPPSAALFVGCVARAYEGPVRDALTRLLAAIGTGLTTPADQTCCGSLHAHAGDAAAASRLAARNAGAFAGAPLVLTLASGCHEAAAAAVAAPTLDALELLARHADRLDLRPFDGSVALHLPCTQRNVVRSAPALRRLLARVPGLRVQELDAGFGCCGAAGSAMIVDPARAASFRAPLVAQAEAMGATDVLSANLGCRLHLGNGTRMRVRHPLEFLADRLDGAFAAAQ